MYVCRYVCNVCNVCNVYSTLGTSSPHPESNTLLGSSSANWNILAAGDSVRDQVTAVAPIPAVVVDAVIVIVRLVLAATFKICADVGVIFVPRIAPSFIE